MTFWARRHQSGLPLKIRRGRTVGRIASATSSFRAQDSSAHFYNKFERMKAGAVAWRSEHVKISARDRPFLGWRSLLTECSCRTVRARAAQTVALDWQRNCAHFCCRFACKGGTVGPQLVENGARVGRRRDFGSPTSGQKKVPRPIERA